MFHNCNVSSLLTASPEYKLEGVDATVLLLCFMVMLEVNDNAQMDFATYKWLARWVNQSEIPYDPIKLRDSQQAATKYESTFMTCFITVL